MYKLGKYKETDRMCDLITERYKMLLVLSRFGIALGFGDKQIKEVCADNDVDVDTFLTVVDLLLDRDEMLDFMHRRVSLDALVTYLQRSHDYFLTFRLPSIRQKLAEALPAGNHDLTKAILHYFDEYVAEVHKHMAHEEKVLFPYIREVRCGKPRPKYNSAVFSKQHDQVEARLTELKNIIIKYYPVKSTNEISHVLFDIFSCEQDLASHNAIENRLLVPAVQKLEQQSKKRHERNC
ncbi:MAG: hemerythrin domain-containing protein [Prevotellaceae bacterium]|jgi:regulator of cell morphogenesis and NO signaling|nr:hemerythrin domain-containing protein [Prevotellaceae bacterium]